jgi:hypothetical protein
VDAEQTIVHRNIVLGYVAPYLAAGRSVVPELKDQVGGSVERVSTRIEQPALVADLVGNAAGWRDRANSSCVYFGWFLSRSHDYPQAEYQRYEQAH